MFVYCLTNPMKQIEMLSNIKQIVATDCRERFSRYARLAVFPFPRCLSTVLQKPSPTPFIKQS